VPSRGFIGSARLQLTKRRLLWEVAGMAVPCVCMYVCVCVCVCVCAWCLCVVCVRVTKGVAAKNVVAATVSYFISQVKLKEGRSMMMIHVMRDD